MSEPVPFTTKLRSCDRPSALSMSSPLGTTNLLPRSGFGRLIVGVNSDRFVEQYKGQFLFETQTPSH